MNARSVLGILLLTLVQASCAPYPQGGPPGPPPGARGDRQADQRAQTDLLIARDAVARRRPEVQRIGGVQQHIVQEISAALFDLHRADFDDPRDPPIPPPDLNRIPQRELSEAAALLRRARADIEIRQYGPRAYEDQQRALGHIDEALRILYDVIGELGDA